MSIPSRPSGAAALLAISALLTLTVAPPVGPSDPGAVPPSTPGGSGAAHPPAGEVRPGAPAAGGPVPFVYPDNWPMYGYSTARTGDNPNVTSITPSNASGLREIWSFETNGSVFTSPLVVNGTVYFGSWDGYLYALNASDGALDWKTYLGQTQVPACRGNAIQGISSSPQLWNGTLYLGGGAGDWYAVNAANGSIVWNLTVGNSSASGGSYNWASPLIYQNELYIGLASDCDNPLVRGGLLEVNLTGPLSVRNSFYTVPASCVGDSIWSTPAVDPATNTVWITTGNEGSSSCSYPNANAVIVLNASTLSRVARWNVPMVLGSDSDFADGTVFGSSSTGVPVAEVTNKNGVTYEFNRSNVSSTGWGPAWAVATGSVDDWSLTPSVFNGTTYFVSTTSSDIGSQSYSGTLWGLNATDGSKVFHVATANANRLPAGYANGVLAVPSGGKLEIVNSSTGATMAKFSTGASDTDQFGPAVFGDGRLFAGTGNFSFNGGIIATTTHGRLNAYGVPFSANLSAASPNGSDRAPVNFSFDVATSGGSGGVRCTWDLGDGSAATGCTVRHQFRTGGNLTVRVTAVDDAWDSLNLSWNLSIAPPPPAFAVAVNSSAPSGVAPCRIAFRALPGGTYTAPVSYRWSFGDGNITISSTPTIEHEYVEGGKFPVELTAEDHLGNITSAWLNVTIGPPLSIAPTLTPRTGTAPLEVRGSVSVTGGLAPFAILWWGDNASISSGASFSTTFETGGVHEVNLSVTDARGVEATASWFVLVSYPPGPAVAALTVLDQRQNCTSGGVAVSLGVGISGAAGPYDYEWTFGDGSSSTAGPNVTHVYARAAQYTVEVVVTNGTGVEANASGIVGTPSRPCASPSVVTSGPPTPLLWGALAAGAVAAAAIAALGVAKRRRPPPTAATPARRPPASDRRG